MFARNVGKGKVLQRSLDTTMFGDLGDLRDDIFNPDLRLITVARVNTWALKPSRFVFAGCNRFVSVFFDLDLSSDLGL